MNTMDFDGWCKPTDAQKSHPIGLIHFHVSEKDHLRLEEAEEQLHESSATEMFLDVDFEDMELKMPDGMGPLSDCQLRVYLNPHDHRGHFHLTGHLAKDNSLIYTNAMMVELLG